MLIATAVTLLGLLAGIAAAQLRGLRLGGIVVVPLVTVYLLWNFSTFPVFVLSTIAAYVSVQVTKTRLPLYGRQLFILALVTGSLVPILIFESLSIGLGVRGFITEVEFLGSILPGVAAYNFHRLDPEDRVLDAVMSLTTVLLLVTVGFGVTLLVGLTPLSEAVAPLLLSPESDVAVALGLTVDRPPLPLLASSELTVGLFALGLGLAEGLRARYGLRIAGVVVVPLVVLIGFRNGWLLPAWVVATALAYGSIQLLNRLTLLYGRVLMAASVIFGLLVSISLVTVVPVRDGLLPFFIGILGGVAAYNLHVVPPSERRATGFVTIAVLVVVTVVARLFIVPAPRGMLYHVTGDHLALAGVLVLPGLWELFTLERIRPGRVRGVDVSPLASDSGEQG
jgi:hypothetical protein